MNPAYDKLPESMSQEFFDLFDQAEELGIDPSVLEALLIMPLVSDHFSEAETIACQRLDTLRLALRKNTTPIIRLLSRLSFLLFVDHLSRYREATTPWQRTRLRMVLCGDDSLLVHAEQSNQPDVVNIYSTVYKRCRKAHPLVVLGVTIGQKRGKIFFPIWVELFRQPSQRKQTRPQRLSAALLRLNEQLQEVGHNLESIDLAVDNGYHSPTVAKAAAECGLLITTRLRGNQTVTLLDGRVMAVNQLLADMQDKTPLRFDVRAGSQAYYWRCEVIHQYLGRGTLVIQRRKFKSGGFCYHHHFSQQKNAKAITVLQIAKRRWPIEVFFRESKQQLGLSHLPFRKWSSLRGHVAIRGLLYFLFCKVRCRLTWPGKQKTIGALKRRFADTFVEIFQSLFPLTTISSA